jgi:hypothetical protein
MNEALPGASVTEYEDRVEDLSLPDPSDRHVLAAAIHARADFIVTFNVPDFPAAELETWGIEAARPDELARGLFEEVPDRIIEVTSAHRQSLTRPSKTPEKYLQFLRGLVVEDDRRSVVPDLVGVRRIGGRSDLVVGERIWNCVYDIKGAIPEARRNVSYDIQDNICLVNSSALSVAEVLQSCIELPRQ